MAGDTQQTVETTLGDSLYGWLAIYLKGVAMGAADSVPGVSGGTIAFITGIYERLIAAITELDPTAVFLLAEIHQGSGRRRLYERLVEMDVPFLVTLGIGVVTAIVGVSRVVHAALQQAEALTFAFFFGLIAASAIVLYEQISVGTPGRLAAAVIGFSVAFLVSGITGGSDVAHSLPIVFVAGSIAIVAMILPGVSGAFFLVLLGQYEYLTGVLTTFVDRLIDVLTGDRALVSTLESATTVVTFVVGALVGLFTVAHLIRWALDRYRVATLSFLVSLMVGALRLPVLRIRTNTTTLSIETVLPLLASIAIGGGVVLALDRYTDDLSY
jgi:putative membrane protein